jgi:hypothetical protein
MTEKLKETLRGFKIWKNPSHPDEPVAYLGIFHPPQGQIFFTASDLRELGFGPGHYTLLATEGASLPAAFSRWQKVAIPR